MEINTSNTPFSSFGSYYVIRRMSGSGQGKPDGLYLCSSKKLALSKWEILRIDLIHNHQPVPFVEKFRLSSLILESEYGTAEICFETPDIIRIKGEGVGIRLENHQESNVYHTNYARFQEEGKRILFNAQPQGVNILISALDGKMILDAPWVGNMSPFIGSQRICMDTLPEQAGSNTELALEITENSHWETKEYATSFHQALGPVKEHMEQWIQKTPIVEKGYQKAAELAAFLLWTSVVSPKGMIKRTVSYTGMLGFQSLWGWDNLFEGIALNFYDPTIAWNNLTIKLDYLNEKGEQPQILNDNGYTYSYPPRPLEGWAIEKMRMHREFTEDQLSVFYPLLVKNTEWWFRCRSTDGLICEYWHGNDSGADNATAFDLTPWVESPDLNTYLVLQCDNLQWMAEKLGMQADAAKWKAKAGALTTRILEYFWHDDNFVLRRADNKEIIPSTSLITFMPLLLGKRLPRDIIKKTVKDLSTAGGFFTPAGITSEKRSSPLFNSRGYWRGPIWPSWNMLIIDGLKRCGQDELAREMARRFCDNCVTHGFNENYHPITGEGNGCPSVLWAPSVFLALVSEYFSDHVTGTEVL